MKEVTRYVSDANYAVSRDEIERLRKQIGDLRHNPAHEAQHSTTLIESMDRLYEALSRLIVIFEQANREMTQEHLDGVNEDRAKLDKILEQNEKIARGIVAIAELVKDRAPARPGAAMPLPPPRNPPTPLASSPATVLTPAQPTQAPPAGGAPAPAATNTALTDEKPFFEAPIVSGPQTIGALTGAAPKAPEAALVIPAMPQAMPPAPSIGAVGPLPSLPPMPAAQLISQPPASNRRSVLGRFSLS